MLFNGLPPLAPYIIAIIFLIVISIVDIFTFNKEEGYIPAVMTTCFLILSVLSSEVSGIHAGILAFLIGMLLVDMDLFHGVADWKEFVACGITLMSMWYVVWFAFFTVFTAIVYQLLAKYVNKFKEIPFVPAIGIAYIATLLVILL